MPLGLALAAVLLGACAQPAQQTGALRAVLRDGRIVIADGEMGDCVWVRLAGELGHSEPVGDGLDWAAKLTVEGVAGELCAGHGDGTVRLAVEWPETGGRPLRWNATLRWGPDPYPSRLAPKGEDDGLLQLQLGGACTRTCDAIYDRFSDRAIELNPGGLEPLAETGAYELSGWAASDKSGTAAVLEARVLPNFYRDHKGTRYFAPIDKSVFDRPQAGWCSWYCHYRDVKEEQVVENARWLGENLRKFGLQWVQIDDGWQAKGSAESQVWRDWRDFDPEFPHGMKWLGEEIKSAGLRPGLWLTPYATNAEELVKQYPDWFVRDKADHYFDSGWIGRYLIDPTHPAVRDTYLRGLFERMTRDWGYDYFKIDGQPPTRSFYERLRERLHEPMDGADTYRLGLQVIRDVLGPNRFLLGCWGTPVEGIGFMNGSRTGGDVAANWRGMMPALEATKRWMFLHNVCWYSDPDCLCVRQPLTLEQAQAWATLFGITGQHLMLSDDMPRLDPERVELLKRILPVADVRPADLYPRSRVDAAHLRILRGAQTATFGEEAGERLTRAGEDWSVVAVFNWSDRARAQDLDLRALGLPASGADRYLAYDFWHRGCLGEIVRSVKLSIAPRSCLLLGLRRFDGRPILLGVDRHITQGAVSLRDLQVLDSQEGRRICGASELVAGEPYGLVFALPPRQRGWKVTGLEADCSHRSERVGDLLHVTLESATGGTAKWQVAFEAVAPKVAAEPIALELAATRGRRAVHLSWQAPATPDGQGVCYYRVLRDGREMARTCLSEAMDWVAGAARYQVTAHDLLGARLGASEVVPVEAAQAVTVPRPQVFLSDLKPASARQGWGELHLDRSVEGNELRIGGRRFAKGLGTHAHSEITYPLGGRSGKIVGWCGVDDEKDEGSLVFKIALDGKVAWEGELLERGDEAEGFVVPFQGAEQLKLVVEDGGDGINCDHADWADIGIVWDE